MPQNTILTEQIDGVYENTNTGVEFTATVSEETDTVHIIKEHSTNANTIDIEKNKTDFQFNASIAGTYNHLKTPEHETVADFFSVLYNPSTTRILEEFLCYDKLPLTIDSIQETTAVTETPVTTNDTIPTKLIESVLESFEAQNLIEQTDTSDSTDTAYRLNQTNPLTDHLLEFHLQLHANIDTIEKYAKQYAEKTVTLASQSHTDEYGPFTNIFRFKNMRDTIEFLLTYPQDTITRDNLTDMMENENGEYTEALTFLNGINSINHSSDDGTNESNDNIEITIADSMFTPLQNGLIQKHRN